MTDMPATLGAAIATEPLWLQVWVMLLAAIHVVAVLFVVTRISGRLRPRPEALAILASFLLAALFMNWLYDRVGYVRLLGLAHLVCWTPAYVWIWQRREAADLGTPYGWYVRAYLFIAGCSLVIDIVDVARFVLGDGALL